MTGPICVGDPDGVPESRRGQSVRLFDTIRHLVESRNGQPLDDPAALRGPIGEPVESPWFLAGPEVQDYLSKMARQMSAALDKMLDEADAKMRLGLGNCEGLRAVLADDRTFGEPVMGAQEKRAFIVPDISPFIRQMEREIEEQDARNMQKWEAINRAVGRGDVIRSTGWPERDEAGDDQC